jgi:phage baseplate assembly protein W
MSGTSEILAIRQEIEDLVVGMFVATDERDWATLKTCFTDPFVLDMTSMVGGSPASMTPAQVAAAWAEGFKPLSHVHHQIGNVRTTVIGSRATVRCYGIALHHRSDIVAEPKTRRFVGTYELELAQVEGQWRIARLRFNLKFIDGNLELEKAT